MIDRAEIERIVESWPDLEQKGLAEEVIYTHRQIGMLLAEREELRTALSTIRKLRVGPGLAQVINDICQRLSTPLAINDAEMRYQSMADALAEAVAPLVGEGSSEHEPTPRARNAESALRRFTMAREVLHAALGDDKAQPCHDTERLHVALAAYADRNNWVDDGTSWDDATYRQVIWNGEEANGYVLAQRALGVTP